MDEPRLKRKTKLSVDFFKRYIYVFVVAFALIFGVSYGLTFFIQNKKVAEEKISVGGLVVNVSDSVLNMENMLPMTDAMGLALNSSNLTITNTTSLNGKIVVNLNRDSGLELSDLRYALYYYDEDTNKDIILNIADVNETGIIFEDAILDKEEINLKIKLWVKSSYEGEETTFVGKINTEVLLGNMLAKDYFKILSRKVNSEIKENDGNLYYDKSNNNYVWFDCQNGYNEGSSYCEKWRIVGIKKDRLVITKEENYQDASLRDDSLIYSRILVNDDSLVKSVSTDGKNLYLLKTTVIKGGNGTIDSPYALGYDDISIQDRKIIGHISYKDDEVVGRQPIYKNADNYISQVVNSNVFYGWTNGNDNYQLGDKVDFVADTTLNAIKEMVCYTYEIKENEVTITDYNANCGNQIEIPNTIDDLPVVAIASRAFSNKNILSLKLNDNLVNIYSYAFDNNQISGSLVIPSNVVLIEDDAFTNNPIDEIVVSDTLYETLKDNCSTSNVLAIANNDVLLITEDKEKSCSIIKTTVSE